MNDNNGDLLRWEHHDSPDGCWLTTTSVLGPASRSKPGIGWKESAMSSLLPVGASGRPEASPMLNRSLKHIGSRCRGCMAHWLWRLDCNRAPTRGAQSGSGVAGLEIDRD